MRPYVLKITIFSFYIFLNIITFSECVPLIEQSRSFLPDWTSYNSFEPDGHGSYSFGYDIEDPEKDNIQFRDEERHPNGTVKGSYGYLRPDGMVHLVHYTADKAGYRATVEDYPRGQLKPFVDSDLLPKEISSALKVALQSKDVYKKQHVQEQYLRPIDKNPSHLMRIPTRIIADNTDNVYNKESNSDYSVNNINPYRFLNKKN